VVAANRNLQPETSRSFTLGLLMQPTTDIDLAIDAWYFNRNDEIRAQRGVDVVDALNATGTGNSPQVIRNPDPSTWLTGVANSGPILALVRQYGNAKWTKTSGIDYDLNVRLPTTAIGKFSVNVQGTYTKRFDRLVLAGGTVDYLRGTSTSDIPKTRASMTLRWKTDQFNTFVRANHSDQLTVTGTTNNCLNSTSAGNTFLRESGYCFVGRDRTIDVGLSYSGIKDLSLSATVLNAGNDYNRSDTSGGVPSVFRFWDSGLPSQLGRRFNLNVNYKFK